MSTATAPEAAAVRPREQDRRLFGLVAEFETVDQITRAARGVASAGYTRWDTHTPFAVHGLDHAMGVRYTILPWLVMGGGIAGCLTGIFLQWYTNAADPQGWSIIASLWTFLQSYNFPVSGKPDWSFPANIPVIFELTVLFSAIAAVFGMFVLNDLPLFHNPLFNSERIHRATDDRFFVSVDARDRKFDLERTAALLDSLGATAVERVYDYPNPRDAWPPALLRIHLPLFTGLLALIPLAIIVTAWNSKKDQPRIHFIQDMDNQEKFKTQKVAGFFRDRMSMRPPVPGTVARGDLEPDSHYYRGVIGTAWAESFPLQRVPVDADLLARGQERFNIYCAACHGRDGSGNGMINNRALSLDGADSTTWVQSSNMHDKEIRERPVGHLYNTITNGIRTMPSYGDKLSVDDRWAVVAYVRALQRTQRAAPGDVPADRRAELESR